MALLAVACGLAGGRLRGLLAAPGEELPFRLTLHLAAGLVGFYLSLLALDAAGIPWTRLALAAALAAVGGGAWLASRGAPAPPPGARLRFGWGDGVAVLCLAAFAVAAHQMWIVHADFIYHWGIKAWKCHLAQGIDYEFLAAPWNFMRHRDYPLLQPSLFAATAAVGGGFREPAMMLWSAVFFGALLAAAREVLRRVEATSFARQSTLALVAASSAAFGIGYFSAGGPDWILALVPLAAWPAFLRPPDRAGDLAVGIAAALAAGAKIEGLPMAAFLTGLHLWRRRGGWLAALPLTVGPVVLVAAPWVIQGLRHGLLGEPHHGAFVLGNAGTILAALVRSVRIPEWHGAPLVLLALPALFALRATRPAAALLALQLGFYVYVYFVTPYPAPGDVDFYVRSSFPRLAFHLVPAALVGCGIALDRWLGGGRRDQPSPAA